MNFQIDPFRRGVRFNGARGACFLLAPEPVCKRKRSLNLRSQGVRWTGPRFRPVRHNDSRGPRQNGAEHQRLGERDRPEVGRR
jgi:hypothetical protein